MSHEHNSSIEDIVSSFSSESQKLEDSINDALIRLEDIPLSEIVAYYFQIMNVSSHITVLKQHLESKTKPNLDKTVSERIKVTEDIISDKFNNNLHPQIISQLTKSIEESIESLKLNQTQQSKSKEDIENEAKLYETLRKKMSTKEFVEQYEKGFVHD